MTQKEKLSRLMRMSWEIQKRSRKTRSQSLTAAWAIISNEDITVYYLVTRMSGRRTATRKALGQFSLFTAKSATL